MLDRNPGAPGEGRHRGREPLEGNTAAPSRAEIVCTRQERIATLAKQMPQRAIRSLNHYLDTIDHGRLREFLQRRVGDGVVLRLIGKWLNAGVLEEGAVTHPEFGTPQGGVISPLLANIYLHYVLDEWFEREVKPRLVDAATLVRFADDFVLAFRDRRDAQRVFAVLGQRFAKFGLTIHPEKTRLVRLVRPQPGQPEPETFDLLGFTLHWGQTRHGSWTVKTTTSASRLRRAIRTIADWCRRNRHEPVPQQQATLTQKVRGHYQYYGRSGNYYALSRFYRAVQRAWKQWLCRRSWKASFRWDRFVRLLTRHPLPLPRICVGASSPR